MEKSIFSAKNAVFAHFEKSAQKKRHRKEFSPFRFSDIDINDAWKFSICKLETIGMKKFLRKANPRGAGWRPDAEVILDNAQGESVNSRGRGDRRSMNTKKAGKPSWPARPEEMQCIFVYSFIRSHGIPSRAFRCPCRGSSPVPF